uniref:CCHC-type domain-containing protein n=1 Tax=Ananas comosus var. bracteatus TaxID=296719 RepID=A0A6V7NYF4_ANACO|nr:unnamed protein product [Ananas comosus var. bracteatus]
MSYLQSLPVVEGIGAAGHPALAIGDALVREGCRTPSDRNAGTTRFMIMMLLLLLLLLLLLTMMVMMICCRSCADHHGRITGDGGKNWRLHRNYPYGGVAHEISISEKQRCQAVDCGAYSPPPPPPARGWHQLMMPAGLQASAATRLHIIDLSSVDAARRLYSLRMKEGTKVSDHLNAFNNIICELESIGEKMKDENKAITLLCALPDTYETLITSLSCTKEDSLDLDTVCSALLADELRKKVSLGSSKGETEALVVRGRYKERENMSKHFSRSKSKNRSKSRNRNDKRLCWFCGKSRHMKKDCLKRKGSNGGRDNGESSSSKQNSNQTIKHIKLKKQHLVLLMMRS